MLVTTHNILKNIVEGVILSFVSFFMYCLFMEVRQLERRSNFHGIFSKACSDLILK